MKLAVLRIRGVRKLAPKIRKTLELLRLGKPHHCVLIEDTPQNLGMIGIVKDYVSYGPVDEETVFRLLYKRGRKGAALLRTSSDELQLKGMAKEIFSGKKTMDFANPVFRLNSPSHGYKDIKKTYPQGELGKRDDMGPILRKMM